jgi:hypothetical protein
MARRQDRVSSPTFQIANARSRPHLCFGFGRLARGLWLLDCALYAVVLNRFLDTHLEKELEFSRYNERRDSESGVNVHRIRHRDERTRAWRNSLFSNGLCAEPLGRPFVPVCALARA